MNATNESERTVDEPFAALAQALPPVVDTKTLSDATGIPLGTLSYWREQGIGPRFSKVGRSVIYAKEEIIRYFRAHLYQSTSECKENQ